MNRSAHDAQNGVGAPTVASLLRARADDDHPALLFEDSCWTWRAFAAESADRAALACALRRDGRPFHIGVLLENVPEYLFWIGAAAFAGAAVVGINPTRRGEELAADIRHAACDLMVTDSRLRELLTGLATGVPEDRILIAGSAGHERLLAQHRGSAIAEQPAARDPATVLLLLFTSGSTGAPKAVICTTGRLAGIALANSFGITRDDVSYNAMPLFHGNALMACWAGTLATGSAFALRRRFSASGFLPDLRKFHATFFNYVGRSLAYILARPEHPDERRNDLRLCFGTEASARDRAEFERRFGCPVLENYGSSEGAVAISRTPDTPPDALGPARPGTDLVILNPGTGAECPRARFDPHRRLLNAEDAIGEIVLRGGARRFEGYYRNPSADALRVRDGAFHTGDLGYRDQAGFFYFAGRAGDWLRVDSENFAAAPVESIVARFDAVSLAAVYPVPDPCTGDQVMATLQLATGAKFDPAAFGAFLCAQRDLGTKWAPRFVRVAAEVPLTATRKIDKARLRRQGWEPATVGDPVYWRPGTALEYRRLSPDDVRALRAEFAAGGRQNLVTP
jgi:fatty-acyl-CoA synthase